MRSTKPAGTSGKTISLTKEAGKQLLLSKKMQLFETHFQKKYHRYNLVYNKKKALITCNNFPFQWTNFEYSGTLKVSFLSATTFDYKKFRKESISEFNSLFKVHNADWSYPYDTIRIYGNEAGNGIDANDLQSQITYSLWLIEEVTRFFQTKESILLNTPLYKFPNYSSRV